MTNIIKKENDNELKNMSSKLRMHEEKAKTSGGDVWRSVYQGTGVLMSSCQQSLEGGREHHNADKSVAFLSVDYLEIRKNLNDVMCTVMTFFFCFCFMFSQFFKLPAPVRHSVSKKISCPEKSKAHIFMVFNTISKKDL